MEKWESVNLGKTIPVVLRDGFTAARLRSFIFGLTK